MVVRGLMDGANLFHRYSDILREQGKKVFLADMTTKLITNPPPLKTPKLRVTSYNAEEKL